MSHKSKMTPIIYILSRTRQGTAYTLRVDPIGQTRIVWIPLRYHGMAVLGLEIQQLVKHVLPLLVVVPFHLVADLPLKANAFETAQTLFGQTGIRRSGLGSWFSVLLDILNFQGWTGFGTFQFGIFISLRLNPFSQFEIGVVSRRNQAVSVRLLVLEKLREMRRMMRKLVCKILTIKV